MARAGLGPNWKCLFANDFDRKKAATYTANWGRDALKTEDVGNLSTHDLPGTADLAWASFPCQDLSLAGGGAGLEGDRSGTFWPFWGLMKEVIEKGRAPALIVLENVCGTLTSHGGKDFAAICAALRKGGYRCGTVVVDAALFVPQSRPRLFVIALRGDLNAPSKACGRGPSSLWHTPMLVKTFANLPGADQASWIWWSMPSPPPRMTRFADLIEDEPTGVEWHTPEETRRLLGMMSDINLAKVEEAKMGKRRMVGTVYKRTRHDENGFKVQRAEVRFDDLAGCLRTPAGGSSRQVIVVIDGAQVRSRLISTRETARLMGLPDDYALPTNYNEAYHLTGDGVVVPVVRYLAAHVLEPVLSRLARRERKAA